MVRMGLLDITILIIMNNLKYVLLVGVILVDK